MVSSNGTNTDLGDGLGLEQAAGRAPDNHDHCEMPAVKLGQGSYERAWPDDGTVGPLPTSNVRPLSEPEQKQLDEIADAFGIGGMAQNQSAMYTLLRSIEWSGTEDAEEGGTVPACPCCGVEERDGEHLNECKLATAINLAKPGTPATPSTPFQTWDGKTVHYGSVICPVTAPDSQWIAGEFSDGTLTLQHLHTDARMLLSREACGKCWELAVHRASAAPVVDPVDIATTAHLELSALLNYKDANVRSSAQRVVNLTNRLLRCCAK